MELEQIRELMREFAALGLGALELETEGTVLRLKKETPIPAPAASGIPGIPTSAPEKAPVIPADPPSPAPGRVVRAPIVGTVYAAPSPDAAPYVTVGQRVEKGAPLCLIEAMKMMNEVTAPAAGVVKAVLFENGQLAAFDQALVEIEES